MAHAAKDDHKKSEYKLIVTDKRRLDYTPESVNPAIFFNPVDEKDKEIEIHKPCDAAVLFQGDPLPAP